MWIARSAGPSPQLGDLATMHSEQVHPKPPDDHCPLTLSGTGQPLIRPTAGPPSRPMSPLLFAHRSTIGYRTAWSGHRSHAGRTAIADVRTFSGAAKVRLTRYLNRRPPGVSPAPGVRRSGREESVRGTTLGAFVPRNSASGPADGTEINHHPSKGHDASILPWACNAFDVRDSCDVGAIGFCVFVFPG
jgi:hypothetical protein